MTLTEITAGVFMSGIMVAVLFLVVKLIRETKITIKNNKEPKE